MMLFTMLITRSELIGLTVCTQTHWMHVSATEVRYAWSAVERTKSAKSMFSITHIQHVVREYCGSDERVTHPTHTSRVTTLHQQHVVVVILCLPAWWRNDAVVTRSVPRMGKLQLLKYNININKSFTLIYPPL